MFEIPARLKPMIVVIATGLAACASTEPTRPDPIELQGAQIQAQAGFEAIQRGDWVTARQLLAQALGAAERANAPPAGRSMLHFQYGRALGVTCAWEDAETRLQAARRLDEARGESPHLALYELALLKQRQGALREAAAYFEQLMPLVERQRLRDTYPWGVADAHERYAAILDALDRPQEASRQREEAAAIRAAQPAAQPFGILTPYGSACPAPAR